MKIRIKSAGRSFSVAVPTSLIFSKASVWLYLRLARKYYSAAAKYIPENSEMMAEKLLDTMPDEKLFALCRELRRIKRKHGSWELVNVESSNADSVKVNL